MASDSSGGSTQSEFFEEIDLSFRQGDIGFFPITRLSGGFGSDTLAFAVHIRGRDLGYLDIEQTLNSALDLDLVRPRINREHDLVFSFLKPVAFLGQTGAFDHVE